MNMRSTIVPKSDQLNADDLVSTEMTIFITNVKIINGDQPVIINYQNDNGRPYKPNKTMRKIMVALWGEDETQYAGRAITLFNESTVKWGGVEVGGLEIKAMSHIEKNASISLTITRGKKKTYKIAKLSPQQNQKQDQQQQTYPVAQFNKEFPAMRDAVIGGNMTKQGVIESCQGLAPLDKDQLKRINAIKA